MGHLASSCQGNERGIYPRGGGCRFCGSKQHLARDCRPLRDTERSAVVGTVSDPRRDNPDDDLVHTALKSIGDDRMERREKRIATKSAGAHEMKKAKVVKF